MQHGRLKNSNARPLQVADWFGLMNDKMGGDLEKIRDVGKYFIEVWKASGMDMSDGKVQFFWTSDHIQEHAEEYWTQVGHERRAVRLRPHSGARRGVLDADRGHGRGREGSFCASPTTFRNTGRGVLDAGRA